MRLPTDSGLLYNPRMEIKDIRRANLMALLGRHDSIREFADKAGLAAAYVSQIKNQADGRGMGSKTARKIEEALGLPHGYMDQVQRAPGADRAEGESGSESAGSAKSAASRHRYDRELLRKVALGVMEGSLAHEDPLPPETVADLIVLLYEHYADERAVDKEVIAERFLRLAS